MKEVIKKISDKWNKNLEASADQIASIGRTIEVEFPEDYKTFLMWSNGGEGSIGENYVHLWKIEDIIVLNKEYQIKKYLSDNYLAIGTDGGGVCYGYQVNDYSIFKCALGDLDINEVSIISNSLTEFFEKALKNEV